MRKLHGLLELSESRIRLLAPNGSLLGDTANESLAVARVNYTRRGRYSSWLRPGFRIRHASATYLVGPLLPEPSWEHVPHDAATPAFELARAEFRLLVDHEARRR